jgi:hypothetical protein
VQTMRLRYRFLLLSQPCPDEAPCRYAGLSYARPRKPVVRLVIRLQAKYDILDPTMCSISVPSPTEPPLPGLQVHRGCKCSRCEYVLPKTQTALESMAQHFNQHRRLHRKPGRQPKTADIPDQDKGLMFTDASCQRTFVHRHQSSFFVVHVAGGPGYGKETVMTKGRSISSCFERATTRPWA